MASVFNSGLTGLLLAACTVGADEVPPSSEAVTPPASAAEDSAQPLEEGTRIVITTNAPPASGTATNVPKSFHWKGEWRGWDGFYFEMSERTRLAAPTEIRGMPWLGTNALGAIHLEKLKLTGTFGGRFAVDGAGFLTSGDLTGFDSQVYLRRARLSLTGGFVLLVPVDYKIQVAYNAGQFTIEESYLLFRDVRLLGNLQVGQFQPPMGLDVITSSRDIVFMEPAAPLQAIAPGNEAGFRIGKPFHDDRATWSLGLFGQGTSIEYGNASQNYGSAIGRMTWLPIDEVGTEATAQPRFLHLGVSANMLYSSSSSVRYQSRPESYIAPFVIDTGDIDADNAFTTGLEAAWVNGPLSIQGEWLHSLVNPKDGSPLNFDGFYVFASWFLTGESRPYSRQTGAFTRLYPRKDFHFRGDGTGAVEVACRFSYTDLSDGSVDGGRLSLLMGGFNWYFHPHLKWMLNGGFGHVDGGAESGNMGIFQTRVEVDF